jgi:hypothetical protein
MTKPRDFAEEPQQVTERDERREARYPANKAIKIAVAGVAIQAVLVNESMHGFCIRVPRGCLQRGQLIRLSYPWGEVEARVVWTREVGNHCEAGLFVP